MLRRGCAVLQIVYDDGEVEHLVLSKEQWREEPQGRGMATLGKSGVAQPIGRSAGAVERLVPVKLSTTPAEKEKVRLHAPGTCQDLPQQAPHQPH